jgi:putative tryptophan/tyrosine transport system substrate-binding protein
LAPDSNAARLAGSSSSRFVDRILKGAKPADLPVEQSNRFELVENGRVARELGITILQSVLIRMDQVIK